MNSCDIYNRGFYKEKILEKYNKNEYDFSVKNNAIDNTISLWKNLSKRFRKYSIFENMYDYHNRLILDYRNFFVYLNYKKSQ